MSTATTTSATSRLARHIATSAAYWGDADMDDDIAMLVAESLVDDGWSDVEDPHDGCITRAEWELDLEAGLPVIDDARRTLDELHRLHDERFPVSLCHTCRPLVLALDMWDT